MGAQPLSHEMPSIGAFYAEGRALVDARRAHLARVGMTPEHAKALEMPDLAEKPMVQPVRTEDLPAEAPPQYEPRKLPKLPGVNVNVEE